MATFPRLMKVRLYHGVRDCIDIRPMPMGFLVFIDQPRAYPFAEFRVTAAVEAQGVFHLEHLGQG